MARINDSFEEIMIEVKAGRYGEWADLRQRATSELEARLAGTGEGIGSSDINHTVVGLIRSGEILPVEEI